MTLEKSLHPQQNQKVEKSNHVAVQLAKVENDLTVALKLEKNHREEIEVVDPVAKATDLGAGIELHGPEVTGQGAKRGHHVAAETLGDQEVGTDFRGVVGLEVDIDQDLLVGIEISNEHL